MPAEKLDKIFNPESLAVIGASEKEGSVGATLMRNIVEGFEGDIYPVNINRDEVMNIEAFSSVSEIEEDVDLALIATPAKTVPGIVDDCGEADIEAAIIISAGFSETSSEGKELEEKISAKRKEHGMRILGPNCLGTIRPGSNLNMTFLRKDPAAGKVAFLSQSGAMGSA
ncbi:CoA-binding protein, partial [Candidatus Bipolaricaulota bacterium]|nr:CoA-binding protein [Candidatus Bipolaricaulota bacterium]